MGNIAQIQGTRELTAEFESLQNGRWRLTRRVLLQGAGNVGDDTFKGLAALLSAEYTTKSDETKFANLVLVAERAGSDIVNRAQSVVWTGVYETLTGTFVAEVYDVTDYEMNGLKRVRRTLIAVAGTSTAAFVVGTQSYGSTPTLYLAKVQIEENDAFVRVRAEYLEPGIVAAETKQDDGGILYVTFQSFYTKTTPTTLNTGGGYTLQDLPNLAFQGGSAAAVVRSRVENVLGYKVYAVTAMMKSDGSALSLVADNTIHDYYNWVEYEKPGLLDVSSGNGPQATPGNRRWLRVRVEEILTTIGTLADNSYKPFSVTEWANYRVSYTPSDGSAPVLVVKGASGYLADSSYVASNVDYAGVAVDTVAAGAASDPTPTDFYALEDQIIGSGSGPAFVTDYGVKWYRRRRVTVDGTFGDYLS